MGSPACSHLCTLVYMGVPLTITDQDPGSSVSVPLTPKVCDIHPHCIGSRSATTVTGTGLGATALDTQHQILKANTNLLATLAEHIGLLYQCPALMHST